MPHRRTIVAGAFTGLLASSAGCLGNDDLITSYENGYDSYTEAEEIEGHTTERAQLYEDAIKHFDDALDLADESSVENYCFESRQVSKFLAGNERRILAERDPSKEASMVVSVANGVYRHDMLDYEVRKPNAVKWANRVPLL